MSGETDLREGARHAIRAGKLPSRRPTRTWGGPGVGAECAVCGSPVQQDDVELELEFGRDDDDPSPARYHVHVRCFAAWEHERQNPEFTEQAAPCPPQRMHPATAPTAGGTTAQGPGTAGSRGGLFGTLDDGNIAAREHDAIQERESA